MMGDGGGRRKTAENIGKQRKTAGDGGGRRGKTEDDGDGGGRWGTTQCHPSWSLALTCRANSENDWTGRHNVVRPGPLF